MTSDVLRRGEPAEAGLTEGLGRELDDTVLRALSATRVPGAAVLVACRGVIVHHGCYGVSQGHDESGPLVPRRPVEPDTIFDIASITKVVATTAITMGLVDRGVVRLDDPIEAHLPRPRRLSARSIRIRDLLGHRAGLPAWQPLYLQARDRDAAIDRICRLEPAPVPAVPVYSDLGMMLLGAIAEHAGGASLDELVRRFVSGPLGLPDTGYRPGPTRRRRSAASSTGNPTEQRMIRDHDPVPVDGRVEDFPAWRTHTLVGEVNDGNAAYAFGGVAGHAGLFSTVTDLATFGQALLQDGRYGGKQIWRSQTVHRFTAAGRDPEQGLGFWTRRLTALSGRGGSGDASFGHRGFTGCELVVDPRRELVVVLLSNRLHTEEDPPTDDGPLWQAVTRTVLAAAG